MDPARCVPDTLSLTLVERDVVHAAERLVTLEDVVRWGLAQRPPRAIVEVLAQDEFTFDVVLPFGNERHLVFDST